MSDSQRKIQKVLIEQNNLKSIFGILDFSVFTIPLPELPSNFYQSSNFTNSTNSPISQFNHFNQFNQFTISLFQQKAFFHSLNFSVHAEFDKIISARNTFVIFVCAVPEIIVNTFYPITFG